jgi:LmbE family N-acetylglucosaminyl deacetylase
MRLTKAGALRCTRFAFRGYCSRGFALEDPNLGNMPLRYEWIRWTFAALILWPGEAPSQAVRPISNAPAQPGGGSSVFVVAHQDDWQVFMGDVVARTLRDRGSATFIYLTAGDDGRDSVYWQTRERAALRSTRIAAQSIATDSIKCAPVVVLKHTIRECILGATDSYFLRIPDGRRNGTGFTRQNHQSMRRLRMKKIPAITAVDGSATYQGWADLLATVSALIKDSSGHAILVSATDPSVTINPHDHFDHRMAGLLVAELGKQRNFGVRYYVGYALATRAANRSNEQAREKTAIFRAYDEEMTRSNPAWSAYREHPSFYAECMLRTYARTPRVR